MSIYVGRKEAHLYHGDHHPAELWGPDVGRKAKGVNLLNLLAGDIPPEDSGISIYRDRIVIRKNFKSYNSKGYVTKDLYNAGQLQWNVSCKVKGEFKGRIYGFFGFSVFDHHIVNGEYRREENYVGAYPDKLGFDVSSSFLTILSDELVLYDIMITLPRYGFPPYEPYTGGKPEVWHQLVRYAGFDQAKKSSQGRGQSGDMGVP